jgi:hypothetical protein
VNTTKTDITEILKTSSSDTNWRKTYALDTKTYALDTNSRKNICMGLSHFLFDKDFQNYVSKTLDMASQLAEICVPDLYTCFLSIFGIPGSATVYYENGVKFFIPVSNTWLASLVNSVHTFIFPCLRILKLRTRNRSTSQRKHDLHVIYWMCTLVIFEFMTIARELSALFW